MLKHNPEQNIIGHEPGKKVKFRMVKNSWIDYKDYKPHYKHKLLVDDGNCYFTADYINGGLYTSYDGEKIYGVKRVMILSRK